MNDMIPVKCTNTGATRLVTPGDSVGKLISLFGLDPDYTYVGALVNNQAKDLGYRIYKPKTVEFITIAHPDGYRIYNRSLLFLLCKVFGELFPDLKIRVDHSISNGIFCVVSDRTTLLTDEQISALELRMRELVDQNLVFKFVEEETETVIKKFTKRGFTDKAALMKHSGQYYSWYYKSGNYINTFYGPLTPSAWYLKVFDLCPYYHGFLLKLPSKKNPSVLEDTIRQDKMFDIFQESETWNAILKVDSFSKLNALCGNGRSEVAIKVAEALHEKKIAQIADRIAARRNEVKVILISGPSSSGKTTFGKRLAVQLLVNGIRPINLSLDGYFLDREHTPVDEFGQLDFESLKALDTELFNRNLTDLLNGRPAEIPNFSFETGKRFFDGKTVQMEKENVLIIEGIHGLNPALTYSVAPENKYRIYVSALTVLNIDEHNPVSTSDNRLIRRIVRDSRYRKYSARETLSRWPSVRRGEEKNIFPFQEEADIMFNSALIYELSVLKPEVESLLLEVRPNQPEYAEASRLFNLLQYVKPMKKNEIPPTSILREFLGGSSFSY